VLDAAVLPQVSGEDALLGEPVAWGLGFRVDTDGFGLGGLGSAGGTAHAVSASAT